MQPHCEEIISTLDAMKLIYLEYVLIVKVLHVLLVSCIITSLLYSFVCVIVIVYTVAIT